LKHLDIIIIHPPAIMDFRRRPLFPGPLGTTAEQAQFPKVPIGMLSLAEYIERCGYKVIIDNLVDRMLGSPDFNVEEHLRYLSADIFAIGLHFQQHAPGAVEIARLCKKLHPHSSVIMGGLTATRFHEEIIQKYEFVDAVVRGEAEKAFLQLIRAVEKEGRITDTPNLTYRTAGGEIKVTPLGPPNLNLDEFNYTRLDLLEPQTSIFVPDSWPRWSLEVCRGCIYNCAICGGSAYSYRTYLGMDKPAFCSPAKIVKDIQSLNEQGVHILGLYQDPRMAGPGYTRELLTLLREAKLQIDRLSLDLLVPADEEYIQAASNIGCPVTFHICPDTGCEQVRRILGRYYSNEELMKTVNLCHKYFIPVTSFFSVGLAGETRESVKETWELCEKLASSEQIALTRGREWNLGGLPFGGPITGPIALDPGSAAFDYPEKYGYRLLYKNLEEYIQGLCQPSWHQWINYETDSLNKAALIGLILENQAVSIELREAYEFASASEGAAERRRLQADIAAVNEVNRIMKRSDKERDTALRALKKQYDAFLSKK